LVNEELRKKKDLVEYRKKERERERMKRYDNDVPPSA